MDELRSARPEDHDAILHHLDDSYGYAPGTFLSWANQWRADFVDWEHTYLVVEDNRIASLVRVWYLDLTLDGARTLVGGVGSVSTARWARGRGYMSRLMEHGVARMRAEGVPLSILWGDRHRYAPFGYETAGHAIHLTITRRGLDRLGVSPAEHAAYAGEPEVLARISAAYEAQRYHKARTEAEYGCHFARAGMIGYVTTGGPFAYVLAQQDGDHERVMEFGGEDGALASLLRARMEARGMTSVTLTFPCPSAAPPVLRAAASSWSMSPSGMIAVVDLDQALSVLSAQPPAVPVPATSTLRAMTPQEQAAALFGTLAPAPYNLWVWPLDHV